MNHRKAQAQQVFIYLLTILIMGLMFFFGIKGIGVLMGHDKQIEMIQLKVDLENSFDRIRGNYGSATVEEFDIPGKINRVCFVDQDVTNAVKTQAGLCNPNHEDYDPIMCDMWDGESDENVFFEPSISSPIYVNDLSLDKGYLCTDVDRGKITLRLVGLGDAVKISEV